MLGKIALTILIIVVLAALAIQLVPYGRDHTNPPVVQEPAWDSDQTRELARAACFDCHSNETDWSPWYAKVAPMSWLVAHDVEEGRQTLNFSEWGRARGEAVEELSEVVGEGEMPPAQYTLLHPEARLTDQQKQALAHGLMLTAQGGR
jgi:hypothetical protein